MRDYHIHTSLCNHASGTMEEYVVEAIKKGFREIAFCDHIPLPDGFDQEHRMSFEQLDFYLSEIERLKKSYPELKILTGVEADYIPQFEGFLEKFFRKYDFDIVLMSIHFVDGWNSGNWVFDYDFPEKTMKQIYAEYLKSVTRGVDTGLFDVVAHLDIVKQKGYSLMKLCPDEMKTLFQKIKDSNMSLEYNTSGMRKKAEEAYPAEEIVHEAVRHGISLSMASDAHKPEQIGYGFEDAFNVIKGTGSAELAIYDRRNRVVASPGDKLFG